MFHNSVESRQEWVGVCTRVSHPHSLMSTVVVGMSVINLRTGVCLFVRVTSRSSQEVYPSVQVLHLTAMRVLW